MNAQTQFRAICPDEAPLPWGDHRLPAAKAVILTDANGKGIVKIVRDDYHEALGIAALILIAVNTCGGFKAEIDNWGRPTEASLRNKPLGFDDAEQGMAP